MMQSVKDAFNKFVTSLKPGKRQSVSDYTSDIFRNVKWTWRYADEDGSYEIDHLEPNCPACSGSIAMYKNYDNLVAFCPACDTVLDSVIATEVGYTAAIKGLIREELRQRFGVE